MKRWFGPSVLILIFLTALSLVIACETGTKQHGFALEFEKYSLANGLEVVLHEDRSDPMVAVAVLYHVGSAREEPGKTGLAHFTEHMMGQSSQHVPENQFNRKIEEAGGLRNGFTESAHMLYLEVVPNNSLEMALWLEADRMGYLLPGMTQESFQNQQAIVQNEKRQGQNSPYGLTRAVINEALYPGGHPYRWMVIGSMEDIGNATLGDVREFFSRWFGPNNATLVVAGDYDREEVVAWIEKYFGEIRATSAVRDPNPRPVALARTKRVYFEDDLARSPELNMVFPTVEEFRPDEYALDMLGRLLSEGKRAPLHRVIVEEHGLAPSVSALNESREIAGEFRITVRAYAGTSLSEVEAAIQEGFLRFQNEGFTERDLDRIKAQTETGFYTGIPRLWEKAEKLGRYNELAGSPGFIGEDLANALAVTPEDIWRVYGKYLKDRNFVLTSFVPRGGAELAASRSELAEVEEEPIAQIGARLRQGSPDFPELEPIPSVFDRSVEPEKGPVPTITPPEVWEHTYSNGLRLFGIEHTELPLVQFSVVFKGGGLLDDIHKVGVANLTSAVMMEGTRNKTPVELEEALQDLGTDISMVTRSDWTRIRVRCLRSKVKEISGLVQEVILEPRWDETEFNRLKEETIETINRSKTDPRQIAGNVFGKIISGEDQVRGFGSSETIQEITLDDLRAFYEANYSPSMAHISVVGDISRAEAIEVFSSLGEDWAPKEVTFPRREAPDPPPQPGLYFVGVPGARQSQISVGHLGVPRSHRDFYAVTVMGDRPGSVLNRVLREEKGYTYGVGLRVIGGIQTGRILAESAVQANATRDAVQIFKDEITRYRDGVTEQDLAYVKNALLQANARRFETLDALQGILDEIAVYGLPMDYVMQEQSVLQGMTLDEYRRISQEYLHPERLTYVIVGDAATQFQGLESLGIGKPILLDRDGNLVK
jgi:zinc protease